MSKSRPTVSPARVACASAAAAAADVQADIVHSGTQNTGIARFSALHPNLDNDSHGDVLLGNDVFSGGNHRGATVNFLPGKPVSFTSGSASSAGSGFFGSMACGNVKPNAQFGNESNAFLGLSFASGGSTVCGRVRISVNNAARTFTVHDWAHENSGACIAAGAIPVPGAPGLLAAGASGLIPLRGRTRAA